MWQSWIVRMNLYSSERHQIKGMWAYWVIGRHEFTSQYSNRPMRYEMLLHDCVGSDNPAPPSLATVRLHDDHRWSCQREEELAVAVGWLIMGLKTGICGWNSVTDRESVYYRCLIMSETVSGCNPGNEDGYRAVPDTSECQQCPRVLVGTKPPTTPTEIDFGAFRLVGCLTSHSTHYMSFPVRLNQSSRSDLFPPEPLHHVTIIQL